MVRARGASARPMMRARAAFSQLALKTAWPGRTSYPIPCGSIRTVANFAATAGSRSMEGARGARVVTGARSPMLYILAVVLVVWVILIAFAHLWMRRFRLGPFEYLWRMAAYAFPPPPRPVDELPKREVI